MVLTDNLELKFRLRCKAINNALDEIYVFLLYVYMYK